MRDGVADPLRPITTYVPSSFWDRIGRLAHAKRQSKADVHREILERGFKDYDAEQEHLKQREQVPA